MSSDPQPWPFRRMRSTRAWTGVYCAALDDEGAPNCRTARHSEAEAERQVGGTCSSPFAPRLGVKRRGLVQGARPVWALCVVSTVRSVGELLGRGNGCFLRSDFPSTDPSRRCRSCPPRSPEVLGPREPGCWHRCWTPLRLVSGQHPPSPSRARACWTLASSFSVLLRAKEPSPPTRCADVGPITRSGNGQNPNTHPHFPPCHASQTVAHPAKTPSQLCQHPARRYRLACRCDGNGKWEMDGGTCATLPAVALQNVCPETTPPSNLQCGKRANSQDIFFADKSLAAERQHPRLQWVGDDAAGAAFCRARRDASRHMASPSPFPPPLRVSKRSSHFTASRQTPPTPWDLPTPAMGRETSAFCYPGAPEYPLWTWTVDTSIVESGLWTPAGPVTRVLSSLEQPTQIYCTTANHHGSTRRDQDSRQRSRIREQSQTRGVAHSPTTHAPAVQQNLLGRRSSGAEACPGHRCSCRWVARAAGWGPVEDHFLESWTDDPSITTETSAAGARLRC